jgi:hypothetical protein
LRNRKTKIAILVASLLVCGYAVAQVKPRIDFDRLLAVLPNLPWDFEIRYTVNSNPNTDMLRIYHDGRADVIRWRPGYPGSLASVCHSTLDKKIMRRLLVLLRDKNFNELPSDDQVFTPVAMSTDKTVSVRLGRTIVRKIDRRHANPAMREIEQFLQDVATGITADPKSKCGMESVPERP